MMFLPRPLVAAIALSLAGTASAADLMDAYQAARHSDPQLSATGARRAAQAQGVVIQRSTLLPQVNGSGSFNRSEGESTSSRPISIDPLIIATTTGESEGTSRSFGIQLDQSIYDHSNYTALRATRTRSLQAGAELDAAEDLLAVRVAEAYFNVLTEIDAVVFARAEQRAVGRQLDQAEQRFEVGLTAITDVHEARARHDIARAGAILAENRLDDAREALAEITGEYMENLRGLDPEFDPSLPQPEDMASWVASALEKNPQLHARELALLAAGHDISTARAGHLPTLSGFISYGESASWGESIAQGEILPSSSDGDDTVVGLSLRVPIFSGFATTARARQAVFTRDAVEDELEQQRRAVTRQTRNAYRSLNAGISEIAAREQALLSAQSALEATEAGFEVGTRTIVDVLLSQQVLFQAQRDYSSARHNFLVNTLRLKQSAGVVEVDDVEQVNRLLTRDAEAPLVAPGDTEDAPPGLQVEDVEGEGVG